MRRLLLVTLGLACGCAHPAPTCNTCPCEQPLQLSVREPALAADRMECHIAPTDAGPNRIQLRVTLTPSCDLAGLDFRVLFDQLELTKGHVDGPLLTCNRDHFDTTAFPRPDRNTLLTVEGRSSCGKGRPFTSVAQCRVQ